jgi:aspartate kinase
MIVMKFGGTSVESAAAIGRAAAIVRTRLERRPLVVVSAMGKTTNRILAAADKAAAGSLEDALHEVDEVEAFHRAEGSAAIATALHGRMEAVLQREFGSLDSAMEQIAEAGEVTPALWDAAASHGERLSSALVALAFEGMGMEAAHLDGRAVIITDSQHTQALPWYRRTYARLKEKAAPLLESHGVVVMGGFIGSSTSGVTTTLGRGGSDFSAAIVGAGLDAEEIQIWTDVDGMLTCDPRMLPGGRRLKKVSFEEAAEMAYFGAKVLHPAMLLPAVEKNIPVRVLNSQRPEMDGTLIVGETVRSTNPVKSIACKRGVTVVNVRSLRMLMAHGFLHRIFDVFDRYKTPVDMVATSEVSVSLTIDQTQMLGEIEAELSKIAEVTVTPGQAIVCLVGEAIRETPGVGARVFGALARAGVNVRLISQGASLLSLSITVEDADVTKAASALHDELFSTVDEAVFA